MADLNEWAKEIKATGPGPEAPLVVFQKIPFADKLIVNIAVNDVMDTTFDLPLSTANSISINTFDDETLLGVEPVVLLGDPHNLKLQVIAAQIGKVIHQLSDRKNVILTIGSKWFGKEQQDGDFEKLMFVLEHVKKLLQL